MKPTLSLLYAVFAGLLLLGGCTSPAKDAMVLAADRFVNVDVGPDYEHYVNADPALTQDQKDVRLLNVFSFRNAVAAAKAPVGAPPIGVPNP